MNKREVGSDYEETAAKYLESQGLRIVERNFRCRTGEIDIIARDGEYLVFAEVKYRRDARKGYALEAVNVRKQQVILQVARVWLKKNGYSENVPCRFDAVGITGDDLQWIKNAFEY